MATITDDSVPETHVLAIASHVTAGYVGNTMATFCMQAMGCEVSAINTVNYSNHVAYGRFKGRKTSQAEVAELYQGLKETDINDFDVLLSGYCPSAAIVQEVGCIAIERSQEAAESKRPGSFFWALDPVMGDNGRMYVAEETAPVYRNLLKHADLILPNQFEAEILSGVNIHDFSSLSNAITQLHQEHGVPHVVVTSVRLTPTQAVSKHASTTSAATMSLVGSTATSSMKPRLFQITVPVLPVFFSGTGDMLAALLVARFRQAAHEAGLLEVKSWRSPDEVKGSDLPLAKALEKVLASMHAILQDTASHYDAAVRKFEQEVQNQGQQVDGDLQIARHLKVTRAAEVRVVRNIDKMRNPPNVKDFKAQAMFSNKD